MALLKCKMCGGDLNPLEGATTAECEYCGSIQTIPKADDEKKLTLFTRANRLRAACEFDKASVVYESIVADFPEEAESYWGLVLCKYGIEYVDDPATARKIPTCHRSSFDSILEDADFAQALEYAEASARMVYQREAQQIEEIRKGIVALSNTEQPYDIFICYKETNAWGERTLDSVLAQDIYYALADKGYRIFFSRITLEDKLGMEYEPYIFAALNSAKIMLVVGTDFDHFNAVWVRNEWGRFLKLMASDKSKHLIPCFKGLDAYDMPKEFARLQAQDLGKVGAMQDLLRGVEKLLPRQSGNTSVIQEQVVVGGSGENKIASLLERGNIALEDGDWAKADSFFEDVLNNDAKNAQAYLGKALVQEKCRTIDALVRKRKDFYQRVHPQVLSLEPDTAHIEEIVKKYAIAGYVEEAAIRQLYSFDLSYSSFGPGRRQQYQLEQAYWQNHKLLSRAEQFATGAFAQHFAAEKKMLFTALSDLVKQAETMESNAKAAIAQAYKVHIAQADQRASLLHQNGTMQQEKYYQYLLNIAKTSSDVLQLRDTAQRFGQMLNYKDSKNLMEHCRKRAEEEQEKLNAEAERQRILREKQAKARKRRNKRIAIITAILLVLAFAATIFVTQYVIPSSEYAAAEALMTEGKYTEAINAFTALGDWGNSREMILECHYRRAMEWVRNGIYTDATSAFSSVLKDYKNSRDMLQVIDALMNLPFELFDISIRTILTGNIPVEIHYTTNAPTSLDPVTYTSADQFTTLPTPENTGYRFVGWKLTDYRYTAEDKVLLAFEAKWTDGFLIRYDLAGGTAENPGEYRKDGDAITLQNPIRTGYTFLGWTGTGLEGVTKDVTIPAGSYGDREYTAHWQANEYTITLKPNGGKVDSTTITVTYDSAFTLPTPSREKYDFMGWFLGDEQITDGLWNRTENITLTAKWDASQFKITYHMDGGTNSSKNPSGFNTDTKDITLADPTKAGYKFLGWYADSGFKTKVTKVIPSEGKDVTLYAKWEMATYTITYHLNGGTNASGNPTSYTIQSDKITLADPTRTGYKFLGWYSDSGYKTKVTAIDKGSYGNKELYAKWEAIQYTITYNLDGGANGSGNPGNFNIDSQFTFSAPTRTGYQFLGWYTDSNFKTKITGISKGTTGNVNLYAKWEAIRYSISFNLNGGTASGNQVTSFTIEDLPLKLPTASKSGFVFLHWGKDSAVGYPVTQITELGNYNLVACFMDPGLRLGLSSDSKFYRVLGYSGSSTHLEIPAYYQGLPVQEIDGDAFDNSSFDGPVHSLKSIVLPGTIQLIETYAFRDSDTLTSITFSEGLLEIESYAFYDCNNLTVVILPDTVTDIGSYAFYSCDNLREVHLSNSLTYLGSRAFYYDKSLTTINVPASLKTIGDWAFDGCTSLKTFTMPQAATTVPYGMFDGCTSLEKVILHSGITTIESTAFADCTSLYSIIIPKSVTSISSSAFEGCTNITFYCEATVTQSGWSSGWNQGRPVIYGYDPGTYEDPTYTFVTNGGSAVPSQKVLKIEEKPISTKEGYALVGWFDNPDCTGDPVTFPYYSTSKTTLYAKWEDAAIWYNGTSMERAIPAELFDNLVINFDAKNQVIYYSFTLGYTDKLLITSNDDCQIACDILDENGKSVAWDSNMYGGPLELVHTFEKGKTYYLKFYPSSVGTWHDRTAYVEITFFY